MDTAGYVTLSRQSGLWKEMQTVANNIANSATSGYRAEGVIFAEMVTRLDAEGRSVAFTDARGRVTDPTQGALQRTGGSFDLAIEGDGFFQVETPNGVRLTRAGTFMPNAAGELVTPQGYVVLDQGGAPVFIPPDASSIGVAADGTVSANGQPLANLGAVTVENPDRLVREDGVLFRTDEEPIPAEDAAIVQGFIEGSNVNAVAEISRMIEVQRAYEMSAKMLEREDQRIRDVIRTLGQAPA